MHRFSLKNLVKLVMSLKYLGSRSATFLPQVFPTGRNVDEFLHSETFNVLYLTLRPNTLPYGMSQDNA